jgi:hypothetical protein
LTWPTFGLPLPPSSSKTCTLPLTGATPINPSAIWPDNAAESGPDAAT